MNSLLFLMIFFFSLSLYQPYLTTDNHGISDDKSISPWWLTPFLSRWSSYSYFLSLFAASGFVGAGPILKIYSLNIFSRWPTLGFCSSSFAYAWEGWMAIISFTFPKPPLRQLWSSQPSSYPHPFYTWGESAYPSSNLWRKEPLYL